MASGSQDVSVFMLLLVALGQRWMQMRFEMVYTVLSSQMEGVFQFWIVMKVPRSKARRLCLVPPLLAHSLTHPRGGRGLMLKKLVCCCAARRSRCLRSLRGYVLLVRSITYLLAARRRRPNAKREKW